MILAPTTPGRYDRPVRARAVTAPPSFAPASPRRAAIELVSDKQSKAPLTHAQVAAFRTEMPRRLYGSGVICRAMHRGAPIVQFAPPLVSTAADVRDLVRIVRDVLESLLESS